MLSPVKDVTGSQDSEALLSALYEELFGSQLEEASFTGLTDTRFYGLDYDVPAFCFGATMEGAHGFNERVDIESVKKVTKTLALFIASSGGVEQT